MRIPFVPCLCQQLAKSGFLFVLNFIHENSHAMLSHFDTYLHFSIVWGFWTSSHVLSVLTDNHVFFFIVSSQIFCPCSYRLFVFLLLIFIALYRFSSSDTSGMNIFSKFVACFFCFLSGVLKDKNFNIFMNSNNFFVICTFSVLSKKHFHSQTWSMYFLLEIL